MSSLRLFDLKRLSMTINKEKLHELYIQWVNQVADECDWKTSFGTEEIVGAIATILENNPHLYE